MTHLSAAITDTFFFRNCVPILQLPIKKEVLLSISRCLLYCILEVCPYLWEMWFFRKLYWVRKSRRNLYTLHCFTLETVLFCKGPKIPSFIQLLIVFNFNQRSTVQRKFSIQDLVYMAPFLLYVISQVPSEKRMHIHTYIFLIRKYRRMRLDFNCSWVRREINKVWEMKFSVDLLALNVHGRNTSF